jgi:hypothetical protein
MNQPSIIGPKIPPMKPVPLRWTRNSAIRIASVSGTTTGANPGASTLRPSTALSTEIAGVIAPSP